MMEELSWPRSIIRFYRWHILTGLIVTVYVIQNYCTQFINALHAFTITIKCFVSKRAAEQEQSQLISGRIIEESKANKSLIQIRLKITHN